MNNKKIAVAAVAGILITLISGTTLAAKTVFAAERISITNEEQSATLQEHAQIEVLSVYKNEKYRDTGCTVILPEGYIADSEIKGMYVSERNPIDSSNIYYSVVENVGAEDLKEAMDAEAYKRKAERKFKEVYGADAKITSYRFKTVEIDGCPAYEIKLSCSVQGVTLEQLIYIITADQIYTITYSQASDDERMKEFEKSAETIRIVFEGEQE